MERSSCHSRVQRVIPSFFGSLSFPSASFLLGRIVTLDFLQTPRIVSLLLRQNNTWFRLGFWSTKMWRKAKPRSLFSYLGKLGFQSLLFASWLLFEALLSLSQPCLSFLYFLSLKAFYFFSLFSLFPRFFFLDFAKEKQKWELKSQKSFYT